MGNGVYNANAADQTVATTVGAGGTATFTVRLENDGNLIDALRVTGTASTLTYRITYLVGTTDVTSEVVAGRYGTSALAPDARATLRVVIKARAGVPVGSVGKAKITIASATTPAALDVVKAKLTRA